MRESVCSSRRHACVVRDLQQLEGRGDCREGERWREPLLLLLAACCCCCAAAAAAAGPLLAMLLPRLTCSWKPNTSHEWRHSSSDAVRLLYEETVWWR